MIELYNLITIDQKWTIISDVFGVVAQHSYKILPIFYEEQEDVYYYLAVKNINNMNARVVNNETNNNYEFVVDSASQDGMFRVDAITDCSKIFKISANSLETIISANPELMKKIKPIKEYYVDEVQNIVLDALLNKPPYISIMEVLINFDTNQIKYNSLYLNQDIMNSLIKDRLGNNKHDPNLYLSLPSDRSRFQTNRYNVGIEFCKKFIMKFFSNKLSLFEQNQG